MQCPGKQQQASWPWRPWRVADSESEEMRGSTRLHDGQFSPALALLGVWNGAKIWLDLAPGLGMRQNWEPVGGLVFILISK